MIPLFLSEIMATNTLGEFSDGEDDFVFEIDENLWNNDEDDDNLIRNIDESEVLAQMGRGEKRKSDDEESLSSESGEYYYNIETVKKHHSKKIRYDSHRPQGTVQ